MKILKISHNHNKVINSTLKTLKLGGLVVFPSDTVYGLLVDATNEEAVRKLIEFKNRPAGKAISVFVSDFEMMKDIVLVGTIHELSLRSLLPGPFTVVLNSKHRTDRLLESEKGTLGVRIPMYRHIKVLVKRFGKPVTATSANLSNNPPHYSVKTLLSKLSGSKKKLIDLIVDAGKLPRNKPSTVIDLTQSEVKILRKGSFNFLRKEKFISKSPEETKKIAKDILKNVGTGRDLSVIKPLIFIIEGELGVGKTIFVKGLGETLGIKNIISPTFVIYYEYGIGKSKVKSQKSKFIHLDLYNIEEREEFKDLGIERLLKPGHILCFEWGEKAREIIELLKSKGKIVYVKMRYLSEKKREVIIKN